MKSAASFKPFLKRYPSSSIIIHHLTSSGVIDERQEALARQAVYERLKQIHEDRVAKRKE